MSTIRRVLLLFIVCFLVSVKTVEDQRLQISSLTIKVAGEKKEGPTFTGIYPSTVLTEQEVNLDTEIMVTFKISTVEKPEESIIPQQRLVMFQSKTQDLGHYIVAKKEQDKVVSTISVGKLLQNLGRTEAFEVVVIVGGPQYHEGVVWNLGSLKIKRESIPESLVEPLPPLRLKKPHRKPEINHIFRKSHDRPSPVLSLLFSALSLAPLGLFLLGVKALRLNSLGLPSGAAKTWVVLFHFGVLCILLLYTVFFLKLNLIQIMLPLFCLGVFCFFTGYHTLCAVAGTSTKEKTA